MTDSAVTKAELAYNRGLIEVHEALCMVARAKDEQFKEIIIKCSGRIINIANKEYNQGYDDAIIVILKELEAKK